MKNLFTRHITKHRLRLTFLALTISLAYACAPMNSADSGQSHTPQFPKPIIDEILVPTYQEPPTDNTGLPAYEKPAEVIKISEDTVFLGRTKMSNVSYNYNPVTQKIFIKGSVVIVNEKKEELSKKNFELEGLHDTKKETVLLKPSITQSDKDLSLPIVRGKVTCLLQEKANHFDCSESIIDLFIAYKGQFFSEQLEIQRKKESKPSGPNHPTHQDDKNYSDLTEQEEDQLTHKGEFQPEGEEDSINGRFEAPTKNTNLHDIFSDIEEVKKEIKSTAPVRPEAKPEPVKPEVKPETNKPSVTPEQKPAPKPEPKPEVKPENKPESKVDTQPLPAPSSPVVTNEKGEIQFYNQAIGYPDKGSLRNATSLLTKMNSLGEKSPFEVVFPKRERFYGTHEMAEMLFRIGERLSSTAKNKLSVGNISKQLGGFASPHRSHQNGVDADIGYPTDKEGLKFPIVVRKSNNKFDSSAYSVAKTYDILKFAFYQKDIQVARVFVDRKIKQDLCNYAKSKNEFTGTYAEVVQRMFKSIDHVDGHGDHIHLRLKCSSSQPSCREKLYRINTGC